MKDSFISIRLGSKGKNCPFLLFTAILLMVFGLVRPVTVQAADSDKVAQVEKGQIRKARASWWGFNQEDCTSFLRAALKSKAETIIIDKMPGPWITETLSIPSNKTILLEEGAEILAKKDAFHALGDSLFYLSNVKNVVIRGEGTGAVLRMRKADYHTDAYKKSEWRHGINIKSSENIVIENVSIVSTGGDGIYLGCARKGVTNKNVRISRVICDDNNRQGISVITAENLLIEDTVMKNTIGTAPESGIDFEPNDKSEKLVNCVMRNCLCENNAGDGYQFYLPNLERCSGPASIVLDHCVSKNNKRNGLFLAVGNGETQTLEGSFTVTGCKFDNDNTMVTILGKSIDGMDLTIENTELFVRKDTDLKKAKSPITVSSKATDENSIGGMTFKKVTVHYDGAEPVIKFRDSTLSGSGLTRINGDITLVKNGQKSVTVLNEKWCQKNYPTVNFRRLPAVLPEKCREIPFGVKINQKSAAVIRHQADYLLNVKKGEKVQLVWELRPVGRSVPADKPLVLTAPSGKTINFPVNAKFRTDNNFEFIARESGIYTLSAATRAHASVLKKSSVPMAFCCHPYLNFVSSQGTYYFNVPKGSKEFALRIVGDGAERVQVTVYDPQGKEFWHKDNIEGASICYSEEGKVPASGVWSFKIEKPSIGVLEDFHISLLGIPPYLFCDSQIIMIEK